MNLIRRIIGICDVLWLSILSEERTFFLAEFAFDAFFRRDIKLLPEKRANVLLS
jgi:hypothetical protein